MGLNIKLYRMPCQMSTVCRAIGNCAGLARPIARSPVIGEFLMISYADTEKLCSRVPNLILWTGTPIDLVGFALLEGNVICGHIGETDETVLVRELREKTRRWMTRGISGRARNTRGLPPSVTTVWQIIRYDLPSGKTSVTPSDCQLSAESRRVIQAIADYFTGGRFNFSDIPLALNNCSQFTRTVLEGCRRIPYAQTVTYRQLATDIGRPTAVRAVAQALARNPVPILIPCHRVIGSDGSLRGFSAAGGTETKKKLLLLENQFSTASRGN